MRYFEKISGVGIPSSKAFDGVMQGILKNQAKAVKSLNNPVSKTLPAKDLNYISQHSGVKSLHGSTFKNQFTQ